VREVLNFINGYAPKAYWVNSAIVSTVVQTSKVYAVIYLVFKVWMCLVLKPSLFVSFYVNVSGQCLRKLFYFCSSVSCCVSFRVRFTRRWGLECV
jgi:hypothetical protein